LSYAVLLAGLFTAGAAVYMVVVSYSSLPSTDGWEQIDAALQGINPLSPAWLWTQHNEHRMVIPKLFVAADLFLFRATQKLLLASILLTQFLLLIVLAWSMRALGHWDGTLWRSGAGIAAFCLFWPTQWENLIIGFSICYILLGLFATLSLVELTRFWQRSTQLSGGPFAWEHLLFSVLAALCATYSLANGNLLWPLLVAAALLLRLRFAAVLALLLTGTLSTLLYLRHYYRPSSHASPVSSIHAPLEIFHYVATYFGSPWVRHNLLLATCVGVVGLAAAALAFSRFRSYARASRPFSVFLLLLLAFCLGTALITSLGRLNFGIRQAFASRYHSVALLFWCCLGLLLLTSDFVRARRSRFVVVQVGMLAVIVWSSHITRNDIRGARIRAFQINVAATAMFVEARDDEQFARAAITNPGAVAAEAEFMQKNGLSAYADDAYTQLGKPMLSVYRLASPEECRGVVESAAALPGDGRSQVFRFAGWAWDRAQRRPPSSIVITEQGAIRGLGVVGEWRPTIQATTPGIENSYVGYAGYARLTRPDTTVQIYAILRGGPPSACHFATEELPQ
jgi:hypothetical protein